MPATKFIVTMLVLATVLPLLPTSTTALPAPQKASTGNKSGDSRSNFLGDAACKTCHPAIAESYARTAHHLTSQLPTRSAIAGKFTPGANLLYTREHDLHFVMSEKQNSFYQSAVFWQPPNEQIHSERFDFVTGSGEKGQTYLYWKGDRLFQLPVSYWTALEEWVNSPGYADGTAEFDRPIVPRCLECHATYFESLPGEGAQNRYRKTGFTLGISCERCHGPGRTHLEAENANYAATNETRGRPSLVQLEQLPRQRQIEICAQCHGGIGESIQPAFSFYPGQPLDQYVKLIPPAPDAKLDVHGNQVALLERSKCYQSSAMTCTTCHDPHQPEGPAASYSTHCLECHKPENCGEFARLGAKIADYCIDCHLPVQDSNLIVSESHGKAIKEKVRNHWIKVYPEQKPVP